MHGNALMNPDDLAELNGAGHRRRPEDLADDLRARLRQVIGSDPDGGRTLRRLSRASTSVEFRIRDRTGATSVTLLLDRFPPRVTDGPEPAEVRIELTVDQAECFARGRLNIPNCVYTGEISFEGPVRMFLAVDPVLRRLLQDACPS